MATLTTDTFVGSTLADVEPGGVIRDLGVLSRAQAEAQGTLTHATSIFATKPLDHTTVPGVADERGARLSYPLVNQMIDRGFNSNATGGDGGLKLGDLAVLPFLCAVTGPMETLHVEVMIETSPSFETLVPGGNAAPIVCRVTSSTDYAALATDDPLDGEVTMTSTTTAAQGRVRVLCSAVLRAVTPGLRIVWLTINPYGEQDIRAWNNSTVVKSVIIRPACTPHRVLDSDGLEDNPSGIADLGAAVPLLALDDSLFAAEATMSALHVATVEQNLKAVTSWITGAPPGRDADYVLAEDALRNPTVAYYRAFTRKGFINEPIPMIPILSSFLGGSKQDGQYLFDPVAFNGASIGAPVPSSTAKTEIVHMRCCTADIPSGRVAWAVLLVASGTAAWANQRIYFRLGSSTEQVATPSTIANIAGGTQWAIATGTGLASERDSVAQSMRVAIERVSGSHDAFAQAVCAAACWVVGT